MFRNNYHPAFVMGLVGLSLSIFFFAISLVVYNELIHNEYILQDGNASTNTLKIWVCFVLMLIAGFIFMASSIGVMRGSKISRNIVVILCVLCLISITFLFALMILDLGNTILSQILYFIGILSPIFAILLSMILVLTGNNSREYFGEEKINEHKNLLDDI
jgi:drug/metabolite transporter (DMT)-like permease